MGDPPAKPAAKHWQALALICFGVVGALTTWFSATAIMPELRAQWEISEAMAGWLTTAVQLGFVTGALLSSAINLPDVVRLHRLIAVSAFVAAAANAVLVLEPGFGAALFARFVTGFALAGVYPSALKLIATWFLKGRGLALGFMVGALTLGSAMPYLFRGLTGALDWKAVVLGASLATVLAGLIFLLVVREGPHGFGRAVFDPRHFLRVLKSRPVLYANLGYFGHMWELYAMWAWMLAFVSAAALGLASIPFGSAAMLTFIVIASGAVGCVLGGVLSDRIGRCYTTAGMMAVSAACAIAIGFAFEGPGWMLATIAIVWGVSVVGDSAQFSAAVTELADQDFVGTALALQLGIGFAVTIVAIQAVPVIVSALGGWQWGFLVLAPGPVLGVYAMLRLRLMPEAARLAGGAR